MLSVCSETRILLIGFFRATDIMIQGPSLFLARHSPVAALAERSDRCKAEPRGSAAFFNQRGSGRREWFCRQSVVLVSAGFRAWRFVRARSATLVAERERRKRLRAMPPEQSARR